MYQALYRKWRPKTFADVTGQDHITETLRKQVAEGRTSHAYLFTGTRGTGKTTCAKILAKAVNCEHPVDGNPCCACPSCLGIENGSFLDVLELDAASNNGVDQVRALRDEAIYSPARVKKRVYIIDEVHMLSISAFNALLKILEEPPEHLMFILATTELHKVPATILSRCQRFSFRRIQPKDIEARLQYVARQESIPLTESGAELLSRLADGALRDALSLLDQCAAAGGNLDAQAVLDTLGLAGGLRTVKLLETVLQRDAQAALLQLNELYQGGKDIGAVLGELSTLVRDLLLRKTAPQGCAALLSGSFDAETLERLCQGQSTQRFLYLSATLQKCAADLYYSANRRTDAELCLLRLCDEGLSGDLTALNARMRRLEDRMAVLPEAIRQGAPMDAPARPQKAAKPAPKTAPKPVKPTDDAPPWEEERPPLPEEPPIREDLPPWDVPAPPAGRETPPPAAPVREPVRQPEVPPVRESAPVRQAPPARETGGFAPAIRPGEAAPAASAAPATSAAPASPAVSGELWRQLSEGCKGQLPPMYRAFLDLCRGTVADGVIQVYAPDDITKGRLDNDRVLGVLRAQGESLTGGPVQVRLIVGTPPAVTPDQRREMLIQFGSQFDAVRIED